MARPTLNPEDRRKQVAVRFGPEDRARLEALAEQGAGADGKPASVGKLIEERVAAMLSADAKTFALLTEIAAEIAGIEKQAGGEPWHQDLTLWGSVAEMLAQGPIDYYRPEIVLRDGDYQFAEREKAQAIIKKKDVIERLNVLGISASIEPNSQLRGRGGLFGLMTRYVDRRASEQELIDAITDEAARARAQALHNDLRALDAAEAEEEGEMSDVAKIYRDMEEVGRARYRRAKLDKLLASVANMAPTLPLRAG